MLDACPEKSRAAHRLAPQCRAAAATMADMTRCPTDAGPREPPARVHARLQNPLDTPETPELTHAQELLQFTSVRRHPRRNLTPAYKTRAPRCFWPSHPPPPHSN